jgi:type IV secretory pathway VirB6-like protein
MRVVSIYKFISFLAILFFLCSCGPVECIDPDNWGGRLSTTVNSYGVPVSTTKSPVTGSITEEVINWTQSYELDGNRVVMIVKSSKTNTVEKLNCSDTALFDKDSSWIPIFGKYFPFPSQSVCEFPSGNLPWCPTSVTAQNISKKNVPALNLPCKFTRGLGLYSTIATTVPIQADVFSCAMAPCDSTQKDCSDQNNHCFLHLGDIVNMSGTTASSPLYSGGCPTGGATFSPMSSPTSSSKPRTMYFKFLDRVYHDNVGSYTVEFIQGVKKKDGGGLITKFVGLVQVLLCNVSHTMYDNTIKDSNFTSYIRVILLLYIIFLGFSSVMGFTQLTHKDLLIRVLKIGLIVQLTTTETSWTFFSTHFFNFFTNGIGELIGIIFGQGGDVAPVKVAGSSGQCNFQTLAGFEALDNTISEIFSYETTRKIFSLLVWKAYGFLYIAVIYLALGLILFTLIKCVLIYLLSFLIISILISLAPIFIPFILFEKTRSFFDHWLSALTSYFIQPIIILTFAFFLLQIFMSQMHSMLGYRVCWKPIISILGLDIYAWQYDFNNSQACIMTPNSILYYDTDDKYVAGKSGPSIVKKMAPGEQLKFVGSLDVEKYPGKNSCATSISGSDICTDPGGCLCDPYSCSQIRYLGYPYLDPNFPPDLPRIEELNNNDPTLVSFKDLIVFVMIIWFMYQFSKAVPSIAKQVATGNVAGTGVDLGGVASGGMPGLRAGGRFLMLGGRIFGRAATFAATPGYMLATKLTTGRARSLIKDLRSTRERLDKSAPITMMKAMKQLGTDKIQGIKGYKEHLQDKIGGKIEDKLLGGTLEKTAKIISSPHTLIGNAVEKIGQKTVGKAKDAVDKKVDTIKEVTSATRKTIADKIDHKLTSAKFATKKAIANIRGKELDKDALARKEPRLVSGGAQSALEEGDTAYALGNHEEAAAKYREAADAGSTKAMMSLGHMHTHGEGVEKDLSKAMDLYDQAYKAGDKSAKEGESAQEKRAEHADIVATQQGIDAREKAKREKRKKEKMEREEREKEKSLEQVKALKQAKAKSQDIEMVEIKPKHEGEEDS